MTLKTKRMDDSDLLIIPAGESSKIPSYRNIVPASIYDFYINGPIEGIDPYLDLIQTLKHAEEHDTIYIHLNSPGGELHTAVQIINAMKNTAALVVTSIEGEACSAATLIFLAGHKLFVNPFITFMIHTYSHGSAGKGNDVARHVSFSERAFAETAHRIYKDVLSKEEINSMLEGKDFWFTATELVVRLRLFGREVMTGDEELATEAEALILKELKSREKEAEGSEPKATKKTTKKATKKAAPVY